MVEDLRAGAILPPIVLGMIASKQQVAREDWDDASLQELLGKVSPQLSIIDGIQRTTALRESSDGFISAPIRVELWLAPSTENLIYRMLVLNTGQIPWNLRRQLEVVHRALIAEIQNNLGDSAKIYKTDDDKRRTEAAEFQANDVIEMYLAYKLRKPHVDKESVLSDQFSKLDLVEAVSHQSSLAGFIEALKLLASLDKVFSRAAASVAAKNKFSNGRHIFDKVSACTGFMAAYAQLVMGKVGMDRDEAQQKRRAAQAKANCAAIIASLKKESAAAVYAFLALDTLAEVSEKKAGALSIGEQERELFLSAFRLLFEEGENLHSMEPAWRSQ
ncbi:hypothetical protein [Polyangium sp. y55x31]|uniref:hypothetical protein n=1 Tax=Polyangium sp. y55x31 TaxID=3042688 RepID=UPI002482B0C6|nr:hypothetical protein [Polyangium sp. y55x31]MDI1476438.1 hypothetical protein [Polyangium sp. y55x31]